MKEMRLNFISRGMWGIVGTLTVLGLLGCDRLPQLGLASQDKLATASQEDCGFVQNTYGQRVSWKNRFPIKLYIDPSFPEQYVSVLNAANARWEAALQHAVFVFERASSATSPTWDGRNVIYWTDPWDSTERTLEGVTSLSWFRNELKEADIRINAGNYRFYVNEPDNYLELHLESLLVHELGHMLGLKHLGATSVMLETLDYSTKRQVPTDIDKAHVLCEYN
jgi:hypothetical protein